MYIGAKLSEKAKSENHYFGKAVRLRRIKGFRNLGIALNHLHQLVFLMYPDHFFNDFTVFKYF